MVVELVFVGTELLLGNIVNTNAQFLSEQCAALGLTVYFQDVVGDNRERLALVFQTALKRSDVVILSGGLGPTEDDLTKETVADVWNLPLHRDERALEMLTAYFAQRNRQMTENNEKQALVPEGAVALYNKNGTAPGILMERDGKTIILLPGPPDELIPMFQEQVAPLLRQKRPEIIYSVMAKICGIGESQAETMILDLIDGQTNPTIATYAKVGEVHLRITAKAETEEDAQEIIRPLLETLKERFGENLYSTREEETLEEVVVNLLKKNQMTLCTAESCSGGMAASRIVNVCGASEVFLGGFVTYSNEAKQKFLGVRSHTLQTHTAISRETALEMAEGGARQMGADVCVSVTGLAGPGGEQGKPAGLVYIGCCCKGDSVVEKFHFRGNRAKVRTLAAIRALDLVRRCIIKKERNTEGGR